MTQQLASMNADELIGTLMSPSAMQDPYPIYDRLRDIAPNHLTALGVRFVSTHDICMELLKSKDFGQSFGFGSEGDGQDSTFIATIKESLILSNPPRHTRLRKLVSLAFSGRMIKELTPRIQERLDDLMDDLDKSITAHGSADLVKLVAEPLPALVLGEMLGARDEDRASLCEWEEAIANANKPILDGDLLERADWATRELHAYIKARVEERRSNPGADIISVLTRIESEGETLTEVELINVIWTIMAAGSQTTTTTLTTSMYLLLQRPETRAALVADPSKIPTVLDEVMRYESPVQNTFMRIALRPTTLGGRPVAEGEHVVGLFASANRDPKAFEDPDSMDVDRAELSKSLAFGAGLHSCLGRALGRQQVTQGVETLLRRFSDLQLADQDFIWRRLLPVRQLDHLYVRNGS